MNTPFVIQEKNSIKPALRRRKKVISTAKTIFPSTAERELHRVIRDYFLLYRNALKYHLPKILKEYKKQMINKDARFDAKADLDRTMSDELLKAAKRFEKSIRRYGLEKRLAKIGRLTQNSSIREWKRAVRKTLGIDIRDDYYRGGFFDSEIKRWIADNVSRINSLQSEAIGKMTDIINNGYLEGYTIAELQKDIQAEFDVSKTTAAFWARNEIGNLNAQLTKLEFEDAGVKQYIWSTSQDERVRECHASFNGKIFSWDNPPEMWYMTKSGMVLTGRRCNPQEDYNCRCSALPVFDLQEMKNKGVVNYE